MASFRCYQHQYKIRGVNDGPSKNQTINAKGSVGLDPDDPIDHRHPILGELSFCQAISAKYFDDGHRQGRRLIRRLR
jgi:hypothetical protein